LQDNYLFPFTHKATITIQDGNMNILQSVANLIGGSDPQIDDLNVVALFESEIDANGVCYDLRNIVGICHGLVLTYTVEVLK
jgi:hypothetical protein